MKIQNKYYSNGVIEPDADAVQRAQDMPTDSIKQTIARKMAVNQAVKERSNYKHAVKPFVDAKKLIIQQDAYRCMDELVDRYNSLDLQTINA